MKHENEIKLKYATYRNEYHIPYKQVKGLAVYGEKEEFLCKANGLRHRIIFAACCNLIIMIFYRCRDRLQNVFFISKIYDIR